MVKRAAQRCQACQGRLGGGAKSDASSAQPLTRARTSSIAAWHFTTLQREARAWPRSGRATMWVRWVNGGGADRRAACDGGRYSSSSSSTYRRNGSVRAWASADGRPPGGTAPTPTRICTKRVRIITGLFLLSLHSPHRVRHSITPAQQLLCFSFRQLFSFP